MSREVFVISDTHFGHENIIRYCDRPFSSAEEMDEYMVQEWNRLVKPGDRVYHLGDVYMGCTAEYADKLLGRLNGQKRLILGNHDDGKDPVLHKHFRKIYVWKMFKEESLLASHVPVHPSTLNEGPGDLVNVHGHIHSNKSPENRYVNACVEHWGYRPVHLEEIRQVAEGM